MTRDEWKNAAAMERERKINALHRRCQLAEGAVAQFKRQWDKHGGPKGGSAGRALLAAECARLTAVIEEIADTPYWQGTTMTRLARRALGRDV